MSEWFCDQCRRWVGGSCCRGCLRINPADVRWMTAAEIAAARAQPTGQTSQLGTSPAEKSERTELS